MTDEELFGYLFDALESDEMERIERALESDSLARARLEELRRSIRPLSIDDNIDPPVGLAAGTLARIQKLDRPCIADDWEEPRVRMRALDFAVVCSVLGIAAVLVFPAIATLRGDQARLQCADNLRQIGVALGAYGQIESKQLPFIQQCGPLNNAGSFAVALKSRELLVRLDTLICPAADSSVVLLPDLKKLLAARAEPDRYSELRSRMSGSYGYTLGYMDGGRYVGRTLGDGNVPVVSDRPPRPEETIHFANSPNHQDRGQNVLYADGSVRWLPTNVVAGDNLFLNGEREVAAGKRASDHVIGFSEATPTPKQCPAGL